MTETIEETVKKLDAIIEKMEYHLFRLYEKLPSDIDAGTLGAVTLVELKNLRNHLTTLNN